MIQLKGHFKKCALILIAFLSLLSATPCKALANPEEKFTLEEWMRNIDFRKMMGLRSDAAYVLKLMKDASLTSKEHGVFLTQEENDALNSRFERQRQKVPEIKALVEHRPDFAGFYIDQEHGGIVKVGFKTPIDQLSDLLAKANQLYGCDLVVFYEATYSEKELRKVQDGIWTKREHYQNSGINIQTIMTNIISQKVDVYITPYTPQNITALERDFDKNMLKILEKSDGETHLE